MAILNKQDQEVIKQIQILYKKNRNVHEYMKTHNRNIF